MVWKLTGNEPCNSSIIIRMMRMVAPKKKKKDTSCQCTCHVVVVCVYIGFTVVVLTTPWIPFYRKQPTGRSY